MIKIGKLKNGKTLYVFPEDAPKTMNFLNANIYAKTLGKGWKIPNREELEILYKNRQKLGFEDRYYWSSSHFNEYYNEVLHFRDGHSTVLNKDDYTGHVICVRVIKEE